MTNARRNRGSLGSRHIPVLLVCVFAWAGLMYAISGTGDRREGSRDTTAATAAVPSSHAHRGTTRHRVAVVLDSQPAIGESLDAESAKRLAGGLTTRDPDAIDRWERERELAIASISNDSADAVAQSQRPVIGKLRKLGAKIESHSAAPNSIIVTLPFSALKKALQIDGVASIEAAPRHKPMAASDVDGSPTWHAAGCTGAGAADASCSGAVDSADGQGGPDVAIVDQGVNLFHSAWSSRAPGIVSTPKRAVAGGGANLCSPTPAVSDMWCGYGSLHGNAVAAIVGSRDAAHLGIAHGVDKLIDPLGASNTDDWLLGFNNGGEAPAGDLPEVVNDSSGVASGNSDPYSEKVADLYVANFGVTRTSAAGNSAAQRVASPCISHNTLCAGAMSPNGAGRADDAISAASSPGPSASGRKKPDLLAEGSSDCPSDEDAVSWIADCGTGTSYASARLAGASALLAGAGVTSPLAQRALLINSSFMLPSQYDSPGGTSAARYWTPDGGWGELALETAHADRGNVAIGSVTAAPGANGQPGPNSARFYRVDGLAAGERVTLAWNRRINAPVWPTITGFSARTLTDLDLFLYRTSGDTSTGVDNDDDTACASGSPVAHCGVDGEEHAEALGPHAVAADARDNVEQTRAANAGSAIVKVKAASGIDGAASEPFALAAEQPVTPLATPNLAITNITLSKPSLHTGDTVVIGADIVNQSSGTDLTTGLALQSIDTYLETPAGLTLLDISTPANATLQPGGTWPVEFTVQADTPGSYGLRVIAQGSRFSEVFSGQSSSIALNVDNVAPSVAIDSPVSWYGARTAMVTWSANDQLSGVASVELQTSVDGGPFSTVHDGSDASGAFAVTAAEGQNVRARIRATDVAGNRSEFSELRSWTVDADEPAIELQAPPRVSYGARAQVVVRAFNVGAPVTAYARYHPSQPFVPVDGGLYVIPAVARQGRPVTVEAQALDALNRMVRASATIETSAQKVGLALKVVRKGRRKLLQVTVSRASTGTLIVGARCGRKRIGNQADLERARSALIGLRGAKGTCSVTARFSPAASYQIAAAKIAKRMRF